MLFSSFFFLLCSLFLRDDVTGEKNDGEEGKRTSRTGRENERKEETNENEQESSSF